MREDQEKKDKKVVDNQEEKLNNDDENVNIMIWLARRREKTCAGVADF